MKKFLSVVSLVFVVSVTNAQWAVLPNGTFNTTASAFGFGISNIIFDKLGNVYIAGEIRDSSGNLYVAKWDGNSWTELAGDKMPAFSGCTLPVICSLAIDTANDIYTSAGTEIVKWDGRNWTSIGGNFSSPITGIIADKLGNLYVRSFSLNSNGTPYISKWDGNQWSILDTIPSTTKYYGTSWINHIATDPTGNLYAEGYMTDSNGNRYIAKWDGKKWSELGDISSIIPTTTVGTSSWLNNLYADAAGNVYASGNIFAIDSIANQKNTYKGGIAKWDGSSWTLLGGVNDNTFNSILGASCLTSDAAGNLYAYTYQQYDTVSNNNIVKWDGSKWNILGGSSRKLFYDSFNVIHDMNVDAAGDVYASGAIGTAGQTYFIAKLSAPSTLPIRIISFSAKENKGKVDLDWLVGDETTTRNFIVQRSTDGSNFSYIGELSANNVGEYSFVDRDLSNQKGNYFYRLEVVDKSSETQYSNVVSVQLNVTQLPFTVVPNPARDFVMVKGNNIASVQVIDNIGRVVKTVYFKDATNPTLSISNLKNGVCHLRIQTSDGKVCAVGMVKE